MCTRGRPLDCFGVIQKTKTLDHKFQKLAFVKALPILGLCPNLSPSYLCQHKPMLSIPMDFPWPIFIQCLGPGLFGFITLISSKVEIFQSYPWPQRYVRMYCNLIVTQVSLTSVGVQREWERREGESVLLCCTL